MRFRLFLILIGVVVLSLMSGLGLRFALAWVEPTAPPPGDNVPAPINVGSGAQTKAGSLTIGDVFTVNPKWAVIGEPSSPAGGYSKGTLNAERLCIQGDCLTSWAIANAFVQNGNSFGELATLGTNDNFDLAFETNGTEKMRITTAGNVGIGTAAPGAKLHIYSGGTDYAEFRIESAARTPSVHFRQGVNDWYWKVDHTDSKFKIMKDTNVFATIDSTGNVGIGTTVPGAKLHINGGSLKLAYTAGNTPHDLISYSNAHSLWAISPTTASRFILSTALDWDRSMNFEYTPGTVGAGAGLLTIGQLYKNSPTFTHGITAFYTNGLERMRIGANGNVAIGTTNTTYNLMVAGSAPRIYLLPTAGTNPELDFGSPAMDTHWAIYRDMASDELRFWRSENRMYLTGDGDLWVGRHGWYEGDLDAGGCFGRTYIGQTTGTYNGARGGYDDANALCDTEFPGSHICTTQEILETIKCNKVSLPTTGQSWISNGPPGYTARANDCVGWTSTSPSGATTVYGAIWAWDANGGVGWVTTCNMSLKFACCY